MLANLVQKEKEKKLFEDKQYNLWPQKKRNIKNKKQN